MNQVVVVVEDKIKSMGSCYRLKKLRRVVVRASVYEVEGRDVEGIGWVGGRR